MFITGNKDNDHDMIETRNYGDVERKKIIEGSNMDENELNTNLQEEEEAELETNSSGCDDNEIESSEVLKCWLKVNLLLKG